MATNPHDTDQQHPTKITQHESFPTCLWIKKAPVYAHFLARNLTPPLTETELLSFAIFPLKIVLHSLPHLVHFVK